MTEFMNNELVEQAFKPIVAASLAGIGAYTMLSYKSDYSMYFAGAVGAGMLLSNLVNDVAWRETNDQSLKTFTYRTSELVVGSVSGVGIDRFLTGNPANMGNKLLIAAGSILVADYVKDSVYNTESM